uniref:Reverse transcriptase domain-containing protein n=1 Tax=Tanacetum cinerariifolium TaxID=118510 RepID=A0A6L2JG04_TANCI|nr:reverse transcriptase domain-containing protein [Tanacetum cinerariifolium]
MAELLRAPTEGYAEATVVPSILAEQFELKYSLINMMTSDQFFGLEKENPHDHICWFNKITSTIKYKDVPNYAIKLMLFPFSLAGATRRWLEKEPPRSIHTWEDLVSKFINEFFSPQEQQIFVMKSLIFNNGLMNRFMRLGIDTKISFCLAASGNTFPELQDNIQGYVSAAAVNYNQGNAVYRPPVPTPPIFINLEVDERVEETLMDPDLSEYTIKVPPPPDAKAKTAKKDEVQIHKFCQMFKQLHINITLDDALIVMPKYQKMLKALLSNKEILQELANIPLNENCSAGGNVLPEKLLDIDFTKDLHPPLHVNPLSGSTTSPNPLLEDLADELALITFPSKYDDDLQFDIESDLKEIEFLLHQDIDSSLKDSIDQKVESDTENVYDDPFDSKGEKIKEVDSLPTTNNEDKVFNPGILSQENPFEIITRVVQDKKLATSNASLMLEDSDPPLYEPLFFKEVPRSNILLLFSSENKEKVIKPGIHTSKKVHSSRILELSYQGYTIFKISKIFKSLMKIFLFSYGKDTHILVVPCLYFYPLDQFKYEELGQAK